MNINSDFRNTNPKQNFEALKRFHVPDGSDMYLRRIGIAFKDESAGFDKFCKEYDVNASLKWNESTPELSLECKKPERSLKEKIQNKKEKLILRFSGRAKSNTQGLFGFESYMPRNTERENWEDTVVEIVRKVRNLTPEYLKSAIANQKKTNQPQVIKIGE